MLETLNIKQGLIGIFYFMLPADIKTGFASFICTFVYMVFPLNLFVSRFFDFSLNLFDF